MIAILAFRMLRQLLLKTSTVQEIFSLSSDGESSFPLLVNTLLNEINPSLAYPPHRPNRKAVLDSGLDSGLTLIDL